MSRRCEFSGKGWLSGHKVSHANNKTKTRFMSNLCDVTLISEALGNSYKFRISAHALKSVEHRGGLDAYLVKAKGDDLPTYTASFTMLENGVSTNLLMDYGAYALRGRLEKIEMLQPEECK